MFLQSRVHLSPVHILYVVKTLLHPLENLLVSMIVAYTFFSMNAKHLKRRSLETKVRKSAQQHSSYD